MPVGVIPAARAPGRAIPCPEARFPLRGHQRGPFRARRRDFRCEGTREAHSVPGGAISAARAPERLIPCPWVRFPLRGHQRGSFRARGCDFRCEGTREAHSVPGGVIPAARAPERPIGLTRWVLKTSTAPKRLVSDAVLKNNVRSGRPQQGLEEELDAA